MARSTRSGDVLAGRYRLIDLLSESGGGRFWRAHDAILERFVALHVIAEDDPRAETLVAAARTSAGVLDPRILRVLDAQHENGRCFVVNEWGTGISLDILVTNAGPLTPRRAAWLVHDIADALAGAHEAGVTHGRLNPENVLIDRHGTVRLIGMCVDAALHGLEPAEKQADLEDLAGLLYCALTATWPGPSGSIVPAAPREGGTFLSPRQVVAGVPMPLDLLWRAFDAPPTRRRRKRAADKPDISSARAIADHLLAFVGDPTGMPASLAAAIPRINELLPVWLPALNDPLPHDSSRDDLPVVAPASATDAGTETDAGAGPGTGTGTGTESGTAERSLTGLVVPDVDGSEPLGPDADTPDTTDTDDTGTHTQTGDSDLTSADGVLAAADPPIPLVTDLPTDLPTEAGMPVFGDNDVEWLRTRATPPPPPPPFEELPGKPLFAPDPPDGPPVRRPLPAVPEPPRAEPPEGEDAKRLWPWFHEDDVEPETDEELVPGRSWLRLAMAVALAVAVLVAVAIAFNLGRGRDALGGTDEEPSTAPTTAAATVLEDIRASDLDPFGNPTSENPERVPNLLDGDPATTWNTETYKAQLGTPLGLKTGVGVLLDLGARHTVTSVEVRTRTGPTALSLYVLQQPPDEAPKGAPLVTTTGTGTVTLTPTTASREQGATEGRYVVLWLTALPEVEGGFRAEIGEVVVRGE